MGLVEEVIVIFDKGDDDGAANEYDSRRSVSLGQKMLCLPLESGQCYLLSRVLLV